jgi:hypothetical protein
VADRGEIERDLGRGTANELGEARDRRAQIALADTGAGQPILDVLQRGRLGVRGKRIDFHFRFSWSGVVRTGQQRTGCHIRELYHISDGTCISYMFSRYFSDQLTKMDNRRHKVRRF